MGQSIAGERQLRMLLRTKAVGLLSVVTLVVGLPEPEAGLGKDMILTLSRVKRGGACETTKDCVSGNVCSKWGWCQWTSIYGSDGPSQGAAAPGEGRSGQCKTSADCASRVPYCSELGFCHGGRLPFDEAQLEIPDEDKTNPFPDHPQGFINNNPPKNNPIISGGKKEGGGGGARRGGRRQQSGGGGGKGNGRRAQQQQGRGQKKKSEGGRGKQGGQKRPKSGKGGGGCPGGNMENCIDACVPLSTQAYASCVRVCGKRC